MWKYSIGLLLFLLVACTTPSGTESALVTAVVPTLVPTSQLPPTATPAPTATATPAPTTAPIAAQDLSLSPNSVYLYPGPTIFSGDLVTFQIMPYVPENVAADRVTVQIWVDDLLVGNSVLGERNLNGQAIGLFKWAWNTTNTVGPHEVRIILDPDDHIQLGDEDPFNNQVSMTVMVEGNRNRPFLEIGAEWQQRETDCCFIHVISGTAAARDLPELTLITETAVQEASTRLNEPLQRKIDIYFIDKVIGHGGYAGSSIIISYLDRNYTGIGLHNVLVHEAAHVLDRQFAPQRIIFLTEGLAVWASGGHFKPDNLNQRAAALVATGHYVPLATLIDDFYPAQHEASYSQSAGFVTYLIETYGWPTFRTFYSNVTADDAPTLSLALDLNLQTYYGKTLAEIEAEWLNYLASLPPDRDEVTDVLTTIRYYNVLRYYQTVYDPTAYFLTAWLPIPQEVQHSGNTADLTRRPRTEINVTLEVMLLATDVALRESDYSLANVLLDSITRVLDSGGSFIDPMAVSYLNLIRSANRLGFEVQQVQLMGDQAEVWVTSATKTTLNRFTFALNGGTWVLTN